MDSPLACKENDPLKIFLIALTARSNYRISMIFNHMNSLNTFKSNS